MREGNKVADHLANWGSLERHISFDESWLEMERREGSQEFKHLVEQDKLATKSNALDGGDSLEKIYGRRLTRSDP